MAVRRSSVSDVAYGRRTPVQHADRVAEAAVLWNRIFAFPDLHPYHRKFRQLLRVQSSTIAALSLPRILERITGSFSISSRLPSLYWDFLRWNWGYGSGYCQLFLAGR